MKQKTTILTAITALMATMTIALILSCDSDDLFGLDEQQQTAQTSMTRAGIDMSEYLTLDTYDVDKWADNDYIVFSLASDRVGIRYSENQYVFDASCGAEVNISDSLYNFVVEMYSRTNRIMSSNNTIRRRKMSASEYIQTSVPYDCVPRAISNMGKNVSYQQALDTCDYYAKGWRNDHGIEAKYVGGLIRKFVMVNTCTGIPSYNQETPLDSCVIIIPGGTHGHAMNAMKYIPSSNGGEGDIICFSYDGTVLLNLPVKPSQIIAIYPFL